MNGGAVTIAYDGFGNRVAKTVNGVTTQYLVEDNINPTGYAQVVDEIVSGSVHRTYTYGLQCVSQNQLIGSSWTSSFYGYDGAGSVRQLTNSSGAITDTYDYDAFGNEVNHSGTTLNNYLYRGEQYDSDLGLYYLRARYYNPATDRFLSRDPEDGNYSDPGTLHKYNYASNDPINLIDPSGRNTTTAGRSPSEYFAVIINVSLSPRVITGVVGTAAAIVCACVLEGSKAQAEVDAALTQGHIEWAPPCSWRAVPGTIPYGPIPPAAPPVPLPIPLPIPLPWPHPPTPKCDKGDDLHHMLPQAFKEWFADDPRYMNVDSPEFLLCLPRKCHTGSKGIHSNQGGNWNRRWAQFMKKNPEASAQQVMDFLAELEGEFADLLNCLE